MWISKIRPLPSLTGLIASPVLILCLLLFSGSCVTYGRDESFDVLFIGNSYTFYNDIPMQIAHMGEELVLGREIKTSVITAGGASLRDHLDNPDTRAAIAEGYWDAVVLQGQSLEPLKSRDEFLQSAEELTSLASSASAEVFFFETWARREGESEYEYEWSGGSPAAMQAALHTAYATAAERSGAQLVPVGSFWLKLHNTHPGLPLYRSDGSHPAPEGSYLAAAVLAAYLFDSEPLEIEYLPWGVSGDEKKVIDSFISLMMAD